MSEENDRKSAQVSGDSTETVKLPDLYTAMAGICYNNSHSTSSKSDENKSLVDTHPDSTVTKQHQAIDSQDDKKSVQNTVVSTVSDISDSQNYHVPEQAKNQPPSSSNHPLPNFSTWDQLPCPSLQNYPGSQILNPLAAAAAQYSEYYNLSSRSAGMVYEDWQYPVYYSNYYDNPADVAKYCEQQKHMDVNFDKTKLSTENLSQDSIVDRSCSTPDLVLSVLQMENQIKGEINGKDRLNHWYSPVSSPDCSPITGIPITAESPAPSTEQDSGFFSEDPVSPIFMSHKQTVTQLEETNQKYYVYVPESNEDWKNYHHINPVPLMCSDMTRKMVNKSAMLSGWKPGPGYPMFPPEVLSRNPGFKQDSDNWQVSKYPQFSMGKGHKSGLKTKAVRPTRCATPIPSTITSTGQVQSDKITSSLPSNMMEAHTAANKISQEMHTVQALSPLEKSTKDIVNGFINRKPTLISTVKPSLPTKRKLEAIDEKNVKRVRHNEPLNQQGISVMQRWYEQNHENPYPSKQDKEDMARLGGISVTQVKSWFANKRNRTNNTRPKVHKRNVEEKLLELCHQLASDARKSTLDNAFVIQQLSAIIDEHHQVPH